MANSEAQNGVDDPYKFRRNCFQALSYMTYTSLSTHALFSVCYFGVTPLILKIISKNSTTT